MSDQEQRVKDWIFDYAPDWICLAWDERREQIEQLRAVNAKLAASLNSLTKEVRRTRNAEDIFAATSPMETPSKEWAAITAALEDAHASLIIAERAALDLLAEIQPAPAKSNNQ